MRAFSAGGRRVRIDLGKRRVYLCDAELHAAPMEYSLLPLFFRNMGKVLTSSLIIRESGAWATAAIRRRCAR